MSCECVAEARKAAVDWMVDAEQDARAVLAEHPHFRGRVDAIEIVEFDQVLLVRGQLPSFHLKQILQSILRDVAGSRRIVDRVDVVSSDGLSSVRCDR